MPKERTPPDKDDVIIPSKLSSERENYSRTTLRQSELQQANDHFSTRALQPSNFCSLTAAENMSNEMLGKYVLYKDSKNVRRLSAINVSKEQDKENETQRVPRKESHLRNKFLNDKKGMSAALGLLTQDEVSKVFPAVKLQPRMPPPPSSKAPHPPLCKDPFQTTHQSSCSIVNAVSQLLQTSSPLKEPVIRFDISPEAAHHNFILLQGFNFDLDRLLQSTKPNVCATSYGSEFKAVNELDLLFQHHPRWKNLRPKLLQGSSWNLSPIDETTRKKDLEFSLDRGNHQSAKRNHDFLSKALEKEITKGWELIVPLSKAQKIPNLVLSPMGVAEQLGVTSTGDFATKKRVTHDLSFPGNSSEESVNSRCVDDDWEPCMFGHALLRIIHRIVHLRKLHPSKIIWIRKEDLKSAYRRMHVNGKTALQAAVQMKINGIDFILIPLRLPFGGSICPSEFCLLSDMMTDAINDLLASKDWNPREVHSNYVVQIPPPKKLPDDIPFEKAQDLSVIIEEGDICKADVFIDDVITVGVDMDDNLERIVAAPCSIMHAMAHNDNELLSSIPRQNIIADDKNEAEGAPEEVKIVLGWVLNTRLLITSLPSHKYKAWSSQVLSFLSRKSANAKDLRSVLGRLENVAIIIPMFGHFLNNIRATEIQASITKRNQKISKRAHDDFKLALKFITRAYNGVNMNNITFRAPTKIYINDASEHGLGGFATHGRAWAWNIPKKLQGRAHINLLEFLSQLISIWIDVLEKRTKPLDCILAMGDNTASMGWLRRSNFRENEEGDTEWIAKQKVARKVAELVLDSETCLYRQWFKGAQNTVADSLSRDAFLISNKSHSKLLHLTASAQVPPNFEIRPVPEQICSFVSSILQLLPVQKQRLKAQKPSELLLSNLGKLSSSELESINSTWMASQDSNKTSLCQLSHKPYEKPLSLHQIEKIWWREQSTPPSHMWLRPSGQTTGQTQDWTSTIKCASPCKSNSEHIAMKMAPGANKKHYL